MTMEILFEDDDIIAINKPSGVLVHGDAKEHTNTVVEWFLSYSPKSKGVGDSLHTPQGEAIERSGIVHRLDRETSGVLLLGKTHEGHAILKEQFQNRTLEKIYYAWVYGAMPEKKGVINRPIGRSSQNFKLWSAQRGARGEMREAITHYEQIWSDGKHSFVKVSPKTGRTHQIRVHMKAISHPVVCDSLYAPNQSCDLGFSRCALHAYSISFTDGKGARHTVKAPLPSDMTLPLQIVPEKEEILASL